MATDRELRGEGGFTAADRPPERARALFTTAQNQPASPVDIVNPVDAPVPTPIDIGDERLPPPWKPPIQRPFVPARRTRHPDLPPQPEGSTRFGSHDKGIPWSAPATLTGHTERQKDHERWPWA